MLAGSVLNWDNLEKIALIDGEVWDAGPEAVSKQIAEIMITDVDEAGDLAQAVKTAETAAEDATSSATKAEGFATTAENAVVEVLEKSAVLQKQYDDLRNYSEFLQNENRKLQTEAAEATQTLTDFKGELDSLQKDASANIKALEDAFSDKQGLEEPVKLWRLKNRSHRARAQTAHRAYFRGLVVAGLYVGLVFCVVAFSDFRDRLLPAGCDLELRPALCTGFSITSLVTISAVLSVFTLLLWFVRLKMKEFLSERHLALDAEEKRTFAQVYVGLLAMGDTSQEAQAQRALVYAALFRPTHDGIVKEDGGIDPSLAAMLTKILAK